MLERTKYMVIALLMVMLTAFLSGCKGRNMLQNVFKEQVLSTDENLYVNDIDGYRFKVPEGFLVDEEFYPDAVRFVSDTCTIEIYAETCRNSDDVLSYVNYTNSAVTSNDIDYFNIKQIKDGSSNVLSWNRHKLSKIENDKNYYLKIDVPCNKKVYTILIKSAVPINGYRQYMTALTVIRPSGGKHKLPDVKYASNRKFNSETETFYNQYFKSSKETEWGIYQYDYMESSALNAIENRIGHKFKLLLLYSEFNEEYNPEEVRAFLDRAYSENRVVELTLQPKRYHQEGNDLFRVLDGYYDDFLREYAKDVADFDHPVLFRFANEMNGDWCEYSGYRMSLDTELYREMYRYIYNIFEEHNADNVIWVWNPNGKSFPDFNWNSENMYYPGNDYVDVLGLTLYNTGTFYQGEKWTDFDTLYDPLYERAMKVYDMPFMITEFSCARIGGSKEEWTKKMLKDIGKYSNIKFALWWNGADFTTDGQIARSYYINDSEEMYGIFKKYFK